MNRALGPMRDTLVKRVAQNLHVDMPWFHGKISRQEAEDRILKDGHADGKFLWVSTDMLLNSFRPEWTRVDELLSDVPVVGCSRCRNCGLLCKEPRAVTGSLFYAWSWLALLLPSAVAAAGHHSYSTPPQVETPTCCLGFSSVLHSTVFSKWPHRLYWLHAWAFNSAVLLLLLEWLNQLLSQLFWSILTMNVGANFFLEFFSKMETMVMNSWNGLLLKISLNAC